jgi:hypothetical protein
MNEQINMGWDLSLHNGDQLCYVEVPHNLKGGTYVVGGTRELWMQVTHNYNTFLAEALRDSLDCLQGKTVKETLPLLETAVQVLSQKYDNPMPSEKYWDATAGNALKALQDLVDLAKLAPLDATWHVWG